MNIDLPFDIVELSPCPMISVRPAAALREAAFREDAWLPEDIDRLRAAFLADAGFEEIEAETGRSPASVRSKIAELGLRRNSSRPWSGLEDEELARRYGSEAASVIAAALGRSVTSIYARAGTLDLTEGNAPPYTEWEIAQIRAGYAAGAAVAQISVLIGRPVSGVASLASHLRISHAAAPPDWSPEEQQRALELAEEGRRYSLIATDLAGEGFPRRSRVAVGSTLRKLGYGRGWGRPWTAEEDDLLRAAYADGRSLTPLRTRLGRPPGSVRWRAKELGLQGGHARPNGWRVDPPWTQDQIAILKRDYGHITTPQLAANLGRRKSAVFNKAFQLRLSHGFMRAFSPEEDAAIRIARAHGLSLTDLSTALGRDPAVVSKHAIRMGEAFAARPVRAARTRLQQRKAWTLVEILALAAGYTKAVDPEPRSPDAAAIKAGLAPIARAAAVRARIASEVAPATFVTLPSLQPIGQEILAAMHAAGLLAIAARTASVALLEPRTP